MASECPHVKQVQLARDKSFLNPRSWTCAECGFTDSVWACLLCPNVACGRTNYGHALHHFNKTKHPLAVEVNKCYVHCYLCDDYILNDNSAGDIALVQSMLSQVASQHYQSTTRSGRSIRQGPRSLVRRESRLDAVLDSRADKKFTAHTHWRKLLLSRLFSSWRELVETNKKTGHVTSSSSVSRRKRLLTPGLTGLRNLGNTCYMNSVLQSLGHLVYFRETFKQLLSSSPPTSGLKRPYNRQTTFECYESLQRASPTKRPRLCRQSGSGGLKGGEGHGSTQQPDLLVSHTDQLPCLCREVHSLMRVMWSGKWAMVSPHAVLNAVWRLIPAFSGYSQQDAQEFLCGLLDVLQTELTDWPDRVIPVQPLGVVIATDILPSLFQGQLVSKIKYTNCDHVSTRKEAFWDLSLDFPEKYQNDVRRSKGLPSASLEELLNHFTTAEQLDGACFSCSVCSCANQSATKQLLVCEAPEVLRLHLKRFRWSGRARHKLVTHVQFPSQLTFDPYIAPPPPNSVSFSESHNYDLSSVIIHHGAGFSSGHYTSYCFNKEAESWVHFNDVRVCRVSCDEVLASQAYILFYIRRSGLCSQPPPTKRIKLQ